MPEYRGQPAYVRAGYLSDLFERWARACDGDEWGEYLVAMSQLVMSAISVGDDDKVVATTVLGWMRDELQRAWDEDWWGVRHDWADWAPIYEAQDAYERITADWRQRAVSFKGEAALEETIAGLPEWVRPMPDRLIEPDPEREQYERLKAKFEDTDG